MVIAMQHIKAFIRTFSDLIKSPLSTLTNTLMIGISLSLPIIGYSLIKSTENLSFALEHKPHINVYISPLAPAIDISAIENELKFTQGVKKQRTVSQQQALKEFEEASGIKDILKSLNKNPLPTTIIVTPMDSHLSRNGIQQLTDEINKIDGIEDIQVNQEWLERLNSITSFANTLLFVFTSLIAIAILLTLSNTIRLLISNRKNEILISKLVGANDSYVRRPFLYLGFMYGLLGGIIAYGITAVILLVLQQPVNKFSLSYDNSQSTSFDLYTLSMSEVGIILISSAILGWLAARLSVGKHLNAIKPR